MPTTTVLVTGATSGLGRAVATALAERGWHVLVHGRDAARTTALAEALSAGPGGAEPYVADLASLAQTRALADRIGAEQPGLHLLVNNAGLGAGRPPYRRRELSADGHELRFAVNYLAPVLLARRLTDTLVGAAPARVVNVGSVGQTPVDLDDLRLDHRYRGTRAYSRSKFALAAFSFDLAAELAGTGVTVNCVHPASLMNTRMVRQALVPPMSTVASGVRAVLNLAVGADGGTTGRYFDGSSPARAHAGTYDAATRARLREATDRLLSPFAGASA